MLENIRGHSRGSIPPLRMPSPIPHDLCHEWNVSRRLPADEEEAEEEIRRPEQTKKEEGLRQRRKRSLSTALSFPSTTHTPTPKVLICWELNSTA